MLKAKFDDCEVGWIRITLTGGGQEMPIHASSVFDYFPEFIEWLEAIASGVDPAAFRWIGEGDFWDFQYADNTLSISYSGEGTPPLRYSGRGLDIVSILYDAFLQFTQSDEYKPEEWEWFSNGEVIAKATEGHFTLEEVIEEFLGMDIQTLMETESKLNPCYRISFRNDTGNGLARFVDYALNQDDKSKKFGMVEEPDYMDIPDEFEEWDYGKRKEWLQEYMEKPSFSQGFGGSKLKELRSFKIERALQLGNDLKG